MNDIETIDIWELYQKNRELAGLPRKAITNDQTEIRVRAIDQIKITESRYILEETDLPSQKKHLLHGRAFIVDRDNITELQRSDARTYYIAQDINQGLIVPGRAMSIYNAGPGLIYYRWTDDGDKWTNYTTLTNGQTDVYNILEKNRFAEIEVYASVVNTVVSIRVSR